MSLVEMIATLPLSVPGDCAGGSEMAQHARFKVETGVQIYFMRPPGPLVLGQYWRSSPLVFSFVPR